MASDSASLGWNPILQAKLFKTLMALDGSLITFGSNVGLTFEHLPDLAVTEAARPAQPRTKPVDWIHGSGHIIGQIGREELDDLGAILDGPKPP